MAATADQVAQLRRMVAEPTADTYSDAALQGYIEAYPLLDVNGEEPWVYQLATGNTTTRLANPLWIPTYDLNNAASQIWGEKAASLSTLFDHSADGGSYSLSQKHKQALQMQAMYRGRRSARTVTLQTYPRPDTNNLERLDDAVDQSV